MKRVASNVRIRTGLVLGALVLAWALTPTAWLAAAPLGQASTGTVTGQVLSLDDVALPNVRLAAFVQAPNTPDRAPVAEFQSDTQGRYSAQVPAGTVWVEFLTQDIGGESFWGYSNLPVDVGAGQTVTGGDFRVALRVVGAPGGSPPAPGMPRTGGGSDLVAPLAAGLGMLLVLMGLVQRRRALR